MLGIRRKITYGGKAPAGYDRVRNSINIVVDLPGLKAAVQVDMPVAGSEFAVDRVGELPFRTGNGGPRRIARIPHRQHVDATGTLSGWKAPRRLADGRTDHEHVDGGH